MGKLLPQHHFRVPATAVSRGRNWRPVWWQANHLVPATLGAQRLSKKSGAGAAIAEGCLVQIVRGFRFGSVRLDGAALHGPVVARPHVDLPADAIAFELQVVNAKRPSSRSRDGGGLFARKTLLKTEKLEEHFCVIPIYDSHTVRVEALCS